MTTTSIQNAQALINSIQAKYRYYIVGKLDGTFQAIGQLVTDNSTFTLLQSMRIQETYTLSGIAKSANDDNTKLKLSAAAKLGFIRSSVNALQTVTATPAPTTASTAKTNPPSARQVTAAIAALSTQLNSLVNDYATGIANGVTATKDPSILASVNQINEQLKSMLYLQQPRLLNEKVFYSVDSVNAFKTIANTTATIKASQNGTYVPPPPPDTSTSTTTATTTTTTTTGTSGTGTDILV